MSDIKTVTLIDTLRTSFATHGLPHIIVSDNRPSFTSKEFKNFIHKNGIKHITTTPYHSSSNGAAERAAQTFKSATCKIVVESSNVLMETLISRFLYSYCNTLHIQTGKTPSELLFNWKVNTRLSLLILNRDIFNHEEFLQNLKFRNLCEYFTLVTRFGYVTIGEVTNGLNGQLSVKLVQLCTK